MSVPLISDQSLSIWFLGLSIIVIALVATPTIALKVYPLTIKEHLRTHLYITKN